MNEPQDSYWSIEACGWVGSPGRSIELPDPRTAGAVDLDVELGSAEEPVGVPV